MGVLFAPVARNPFPCNEIVMHPATERGGRRLGLDAAATWPESGVSARTGTPRECPAVTVPTPHEGGWNRR